MNNLNLKILLVIGGMLSTPVFALSQSLEQQMDRVDSAASSAAPSSQTTTTTYKQYVQQQIDSLSGFGPVDPFLQCTLAKFQLTGDQTGFTMVGGNANSCATSSGLNPAGSATGPSGSSGGGSGSGGNSGRGLGGGNSNNPHVPDWWGGGVFQ